jgi:alkanesulfonate monooxygenase
MTGATVMGAMPSGRPATTFCDAHRQPADRSPRVALTFRWFLPTNGDSRHVVSGGHGTPATASGQDRPPTVAHLSRIAGAAEDLGFTCVLTPTGA